MNRNKDMYVYAIFGFLVGCEPPGQKELSVSVVDSFEKEDEEKYGFGKQCIQFHPSRRY